jgi:NAD(P)-dependent dehydrogenase (short-subunit alcohol dehydrogenase family)
MLDSLPQRREKNIIPLSGKIGAGESMKNLRGRVALITGAASGLGAGLARVCAAAGMRVVVSDVRELPLARLNRSIADAGGAVFSELADVLDPSSVEALLAAVYERCGALNLVSAAVPRMRAAGEPCHIVNVASMSGLAPALEPAVGVYAASKSALISYSEVLAHELEADGIAVSVACPGGMATGIFDADRHRPSALRPEGFEPPPPGELGALAGMLSPDTAARRIIEGVRHERFYLFTHPDEWERLRVHWARVRADFDAARASPL